ncbi:MAG TPA: MFS transporter [Gammaproteobacteria bacterium]|nr:MFS transporter [Gammaproteobacteria bacterium]
MTSAAKIRGWRGIIAAFATPSAGTLCVLGFGSGLPFLLIGYTLSIWLREAGWQLSTIGLLSYISLLYVFKFVWAPLLDRWNAPVIGVLGRRRGWLALAIAVLVAALAGIAIVGPSQLETFIALVALTALAGSTQDTMVDAYRIEIAPVEAQAALAATYTLGYRFGLIVSGAGALYISAFGGWRLAYFCMAGCMLAPLCMTLFAREPDATQRLQRPNFAEAFAEPFVDFFRRYGIAVAIALLVFVGLFKMPDQMLGVIAGPFYIDTGYSNAQIATVSKIYGIWIGIAGAFLGGISVSALGMRRSIVIAMFCLALSNLLYLLMATHPSAMWAFIATISGDNGSLGFAGVVLIAFLSSLTSREFTATQYALLVSLANLPGKLVGGMSGYIVEASSYTAFFVFSTISVVPALLLWWWLSKTAKMVDL